MMEVGLQTFSPDLETDQNTRVKPAEQGLSGQSSEVRWLLFEFVQITVEEEVTLV